MVVSDELLPYIETNLAVHYIILPPTTSPDPVQSCGCRIEKKKRKKKEETQKDILEMAEVDLNEYNGGRLVGATIALLALSWITMGLRAYTRAVIMRSFMADDWLMLIAQVGWP